MDVRKLTRNRGWWRLFIVSAGAWYGGWLIGGVWSAIDEWQNPPPEPNPFDEIFFGPPDPILPPLPWYADSEFWIPLVVIVLIPWFVFFGFRMARWIIEGFASPMNRV